MIKLTQQQLTGLTTSHLVQDQGNKYLHPNAKKALDAMRSAAIKQGFTLNVASGFRDFDRQKLIWNNKYSGKTAILSKSEIPILPDSLSEYQKLMAILHWSALPGASRHHWGSDLDIYDKTLLPPNQSLQLTTSEYDQDGYFFELTQWLNENMARFDFFSPYQQDLGGVAREPWHISFRPIAEQALIDLDEMFIFNLISQKNILGNSLICKNLPTIYKQFILNISN